MPELRQIADQIKNGQIMFNDLDSFVLNNDKTEDVKNKVIDIDGSTTLELGDRVIMCLLHSAIQKVEDFLSEDKEII